MSGSDHPPVAFYCVSNDRYFLGAVAMLNSLRLQGHAEPVFLLDCGLTPAQRELVATQATVVQATADSLPFLLKTEAPLRHPAEVMVLIDADMIVTRPLGELIEKAAAGQVVAFRNDYERFHPEWGELLGLGEARRQASISSGLVFMGGSLGVEILRLMDRSQRRVESEFTSDGGRVFHPAFLTLDQDILNAVLCTSVTPERITALEYRLAPTPPFTGLRLVDEANLCCAYEDGQRTYVLHHLAQKPWLRPMHHGIYSRLLVRLLLADDVPVRVPESQLPLRMRSGTAARLVRAWVDARDLIGWRVRDLLPESLISRFDARRQRRGA
jgi:hypothetical protein